jgi:hypothetical protein
MAITHNTEFSEWIFECILNTQLTTLAVFYTNYIIFRKFEIKKRSSSNFVLGKKIHPLQEYQRCTKKYTTKQTQNV